MAERGSAGSARLWPVRIWPDVTTASNLILAGDYLKSDWEVANMETANHNGRRAANAILRRSGSDAPAAAVVEYPQPPEWEPLRAVDATRYALGQPNLVRRRAHPAPASGPE